MSPSVPGRSRTASGLTVLALAASTVALALPASAAPSDRFGPAPVTSLRAAALETGGSAGALLPRGISYMPPPVAPGSRTAALRTAPTANLTAAKVSTINVTFVNTASNAWTQPARDAFRAAADVWERTIESPVPIEIEATARGLGFGVLGGAGPYDFLRNEGATVVPSNRNPTAAELRDDVFEPIALYNARTGRDFAPAGTDYDGDGEPDRNPDIEAEFNPNLSGLYFGTDGRPPADQVDFRSIVLHEIGHGLGLVGTADVSGDRARIGDASVNAGTGVRSGVSFDQFAYSTAPAAAGNGGVRVLSLADGSAALKTALTGDTLYWAGQLARTAAGGSEVELYAPSQCGQPGPPRACASGEDSFSSGTSFSHLDETVYGTRSPNGLMTPFLDRGEAYADAGQIAMGMLADMGYAVPAISGARYTALDPVRVLDTRAGTGARRGVVPAGGTLDLQVAGVNGVPAGATAVVLNVTGVSPSTATDVRVYPTPVTQTPVPVVSNLNLARGTTRANLVTVPVGNDGKVRLRNDAGTVSLVADLSGYYAPAAASTFTAVDPVRILDTRSAVGTPTRTRVATGTVDLQVTGQGGVPAGATAVALTVTAVNASRSTDVRVYPTPATSTVPLVSNINVRVGPGVPNVVIVKIGQGGKVRLRNDAGEVHLLADVAGYYDGSTGGSLFRPVTPLRILDTRTRVGQPAGSATRVGPGQVRDLRVGGVGQVPSLASSVVLNVTGVAASASTDVRVYPATASAVPTVSNLNLARGLTAADLVVVKLGNRSVRLRNNSGTVALLADVSGWFGPAS